MDQFSTLILPLIVFAVIVYFLMIRPQNKQQKERRQLLNSIRPKDKVVTIGGIHGTVTKVREDTVIIRVSANSEIEFSKTAVQNILNRNYKDTPAKETKGKNKLKEDSEAAKKQDDFEETDNDLIESEQDDTSEEENTDAKR